MNSKFLLMLALLSSTNSIAGTVAPSPREAINISSDAIPDGSAGIIVNAGCYGTNNRGTTNPLSPSSRIVLYLSNVKESLLVDFPSSIIAMGGAGSPGECGVTKINDNTVITPAGNYTMSQILASAGSGGGLIVSALSAENLKTKNGRTSIACSQFPINYAADFAIDNVTSYYAIQVFNTTVNPQSFYGYNGQMDRGTKISIKASTVSSGYNAESKFLSIQADFPGQDGFCGGYHSPLMLFFEEAFPLFSGRSTLLKGEKNPTTWVEPNHEGYFLVHLKSPDAAITADRLFGDSGEIKNGFEALKKIDSNRDSVINKKDKEFKNLYLWKDLNGDSKNDKGEIQSLSAMKVESIDLKYNDGYHLDKGAAVFKGRTTFKFKDAEKKEKEGQIFDIFFSDKK